MATTIPPVIVPKPTPFPPARYGLLQAAYGPFDLPVHARNGGLVYQHAMCGDAYGYEVNCIDAQATKDGLVDEVGTDLTAGDPFIVYATLTCGPVGNSFQEFEDLVRQRLLSKEQSIVEQALSTGDFGAVPALTTANGIATLTPTATTVVDIVSELEDAMYCTSMYGAPAFLHMNIAPFNQLKSQHLIEFDGLRWRTPMGSIVSAGCYANEDPDGGAAADGTFWMYVTGGTAVWRSSDIFIAPVEGSLNRATNQMVMLAEREYVVTFECGGFAASVELWGGGR